MSRLRSGAWVLKAAQLVEPEDVVGSLSEGVGPVDR